MYFNNIYEMILPYDMEYVLTNCDENFILGNRY